MVAGFATARDAMALPLSVVAFPPHIERREDCRALFPTLPVVGFLVISFFSEALSPSTCEIFLLAGSILNSNRERGARVANSLKVGIRFIFFKCSSAWHPSPEFGSHTFSCGSKTLIAGVQENLAMKHGIDGFANLNPFLSWIMISFMQIFSDILHLSTLLPSLQLS
jgi:hypothetical protein